MVFVYLVFFGGRVIISYYFLTHSNLLCLSVISKYMRLINSMLWSARYTERKIYSGTFSIFVVVCTHSSIVFTCKQKCLVMVRNKLNLNPTIFKPTTCALHSYRYRKIFFSLFFVYLQYFYAYVYLNL